MGTTGRPETVDVAARLRRRLNAVGTANVAAALCLLAVNGALEQANFRRPPARRFRRRRYWSSAGVLGEHQHAPCAARLAGGGTWSA
jgi:hypothetical protein